MANALVKFPESGGDWKEIDGPGMYVLSVLQRGSESDRCAVGAAIVMLRPQGKLLTPVAPMWPTMEARGYDAALLEEAAQIFEEKGQSGKAATLRAQLPIMDLSVEFVQATHMGSTSRTFQHKETGEYWQARWEDLTPAGLLHLHQIHTAFVRPPVLLTFLGDGEEEE